MIYFYEFLKGASLALMLFGAWYFYALNASLFHIFVGALPGFLVFLISILLAKNEDLTKALKEKQGENP